MRTPPTVYLDSQDYSRFGDVLRGKSDAKTELLFLELEARKIAGDVVFAVSMPIIGEILQYNSEFRETTIKKAEAVERLCGTCALAFPSRLLTAQIIDAAKSRGINAETSSIDVLTHNRYWYPNVAQSFDGLHDKMQVELNQKLAAMPQSRKLRRGAAKHARKIDFYKLARDAAPEMAARYGIPADAIIQSIVPLLRGRISSEQASHNLFSVIAEPVKFVEIYFEKIETDRSLPVWIGKMGRDIHASLESLRQTLLPTIQSEASKTQLKSIIVDQKAKIGRIIIRLALDDDEDSELDSNLRDLLDQDLAFCDSLPACKIFGGALALYIEQIIGLSGSKAKIETSLGGDLLHSLYLPYVDLWRGDHRFSEILKKAVPEYADRIVPTISALPKAIDSWLTVPRP